MLTVLFHSSPILGQDQFSTTIAVTDNVLPPEQGTFRNVSEIARGLAAYTEEVQKQRKPARVGIIARKQHGERKPAGFDKWRREEGSVDVCLNALPEKNAA